MTVARLEKVFKRFPLKGQRKSVFNTAATLLRGHGSPSARMAVDDLSWEIGAGERWGLLGPNGSGKSTLLRIIAGILRPTSGTVEINARVAPFFSWYAGFMDDLDTVENVFLYGSLLGMGNREIKRKLDAILEFAELAPFVNEKLRIYSTGMKARLSFAVGIHTEADLFLFDEIFSVGDRAFQEKCLAILKNLSKEGRAMVIASHDAAAITEMTEKSLYMENGKLVSIGATAAVLEARKNRV